MPYTYRTAEAKRKAVLRLSFTALFAALVASGTFIAFPPFPYSPVPVVLQNFFVLLAGLVLGPVSGTASVALYLAAGTLGAPVFAGGSGGIVHLAGPTGGFLFGYLLSAFTAGIIAGTPKAGKKIPLWRVFLAAFPGLLVVYIPGVTRLKFAMGGPWTDALITGLVPFIPGDIVKGIMASLVAPRLRRAAADRLDI
ncbi:MAG: biotin transporter BioY [Treponema sp.]|jgi:biotin transport system substrate-specific component|nr:biotin transporter BioY [Treponema sp.]